MAVSEKNFFFENHSTKYLEVKALEEKFMIENFLIKLIRFRKTGPIGNYSAGKSEIKNP